MGRPIKKSFFGNLNSPYDNYNVGGVTGAGGGTGVLSVALGTPGTRYSAGTTLVASAPGGPSGVAATFLVNVSTSTGEVTSYTVVTPGSGYRTTATVTLTTASGVSVAGTGTTATTTIYVGAGTGIYAGMYATGTGVGASAKVLSVVGTAVTVDVANAGPVSGSIAFTDLGSNGVPGAVTMTAVGTNALAVMAYLPGGSAKLSDIMKQEASRRYLVRNADGTGQCALKAKSSGTLAEGEMNLIATDAAGATYYVTKLTARRATLSRISGSYEFADGASVGWNITGAVTGVSVRLDTV